MIRQRPIVALLAAEVVSSLGSQMTRLAVAGAVIAYRLVSRVAPLRLAGVATLAFLDGTTRSGAPVAQEAA